MYVRIYRFLLSQYGQDVSNQDDSLNPHTVTNSESEVERHDSIRPADWEARLAGKPPKTGELMRDKLKSLHAANERDEQPGPLIAGLNKSSWIAVQSFRKPADAYYYCFVLRIHDVQRKVRRHGRVTIIEVQLRDKAIAEELLPSWDKLH